eukprot:CAMPEP_0171222918 /NCGR_PEP_ID=MMETSP0790-20130122/35511_1 /TAXON_ID=2925 /ORGANISM="Alexandrium catenella, Strain OF101" /LENGTH=224 /DNA_ID=CAMNT_0011688879 /DNA_START=17 /DNA_END=688 /DNA_ORIENTATION=-
MIPLLAGPPIMGPPTREMLAKLGHVKWCVIATYACAVGRFWAKDPFGALNDLFGGLFGTFLLREDPSMEPCFRCLKESPLGAMSDGGLTCLLPYMFMACLNGMFSALRVYTILEKFGTLFPCENRVVCLLPSWLCLSATAQIFAVVFCWKVYKLMQAQAFSGLYMHPLDVEARGSGSSTSSPGDGTQPGSNEQGGRSGGSGANPLRAAGFTPWQGAGHQLGEPA